MSKNRPYIFLIGIIIFLIAGYYIADSILFDGVKPRIINENGVRANYFAKNTPGKRATVILIGGGQWGDYWGQEFAKQGYVGLSLPYIGREGLPQFPEEINLEYFEKALLWLVAQPEVNPDKIIVMGASRNAELSLILATQFTNLVGGAIAYAPSSVSWSNTVLPYNSDEIKPSWKYKGVPIPYIPMNKIPGNNTNKIETLEYWKSGLAKTEFVSQATIKVEKINGPILLLSGKDDKVWPSAIMANMIEQRIKENNFKYTFQNIQYDNSGHLISSHPEINSDYRIGFININNKEYEYENGGTKEGDLVAKKDAKIKLFELLKGL